MPELTLIFNNFLRSLDRILGSIQPLKEVLYKLILLHRGLLTLESVQLLLVRG